MKIGVLTIICLIYDSSERPAEELELERYLREISMSSNTNLTTLNATEANKSDGNIIDVEADKFINDLKKLAETQVSQPRELQNLTKADGKNNSNSSTHIRPDLFHFTQLSSSSFRIKALLLRPWNNKYFYPTNKEYAELERALSDSINKAYENDNDFLMFHLISFNFQENLSFYSDFILTFKTNQTHLSPFLQIISDGQISGIPLSLQKTFIYALDENDDLNNQCSLQCTPPQCADSCPETCCRPKIEVQNNKTEKAIENVKVNSSQSEASIPPVSSNYFPVNISAIHNEIMKIFESLSLQTLKEHQLNVSETAETSQTTTMPKTTPALPSTLDVSYGTDLQSATNSPTLNFWGYQYQGYPNLDEKSPSSSEFNDYSFESSPFETSKRNKVPMSKNYPSQTSQAQYNQNNYRKNTNNAPSYINNPVPQSQLENRMQIERTKTNNYRGKLKIWYPNI